MWQETKHGLFRQFNFKDLKEALNFISEVGKVAENYRHYPRIETEWSVVQVWLFSKNEDNLITKQDYMMSEEISGIYSRFNDNGPMEDFESESRIENIKEVKLFADGGSRGNPGPSSSGYVIMTLEDEILADRGIYLGITTNNQAEYTALKLGLEECRKLGYRTVHVFMDSLLVINQMKGIYKIKNRDLWPIHNAIKQMVNDFKKVTFQHVPRELNKLADAAVNRALDEKKL